MLVSCVKIALLKKILPFVQLSIAGEKILFIPRRLPVFLADVLLVAVSFLLAHLLRYDFHLYKFIESDAFVSTFIITLIVKPTVFLLSGMYRNLWRYASLQDAIEIFRIVALAKLAVFCSLIFFREFEHFSRSIFILDWFVLLALICGSRLLWRAYRETYFRSRGTGNRQRTLIVGAGCAGSMLVKEIRQQSQAPYKIIGFVDDDPEKAGMRLHGIPVLGMTPDLEFLVQKHRIEKVIMAIPSAPKSVVRAIVTSCESAAVRFKIVPGLSDILTGKVSVSHVKDVEIEDLLGREPVILNEEKIRRYLAGKVVLVTGAAGSIGSEICRQVARFAPEQLILFDQAETPLYYIEKELVQDFASLRIVPVIADICNAARVNAVFDEFIPDVVFHAAAYKHVPMMEYNPIEAVMNNIRGTQNLADAADRLGVSNFVMISTDKAVNPTNVMGASKRTAEIYVQALSHRSKTNFTTVRFGNVLGSNGSVIPLFKEQIAGGGPVTVTDPEIIRYFMTIPEATQLVLQAGCIGNGGEIFVLDMGEPIKILELAEQLIRLSGFTPYKDIDIVFTGLRPGEKLFEELLISGEGVKPTEHRKIKVLSANPQEFSVVAEELDRMIDAAEASDTDIVFESLQRLVPEFTHRKLPFSRSGKESSGRMRPTVIKFPRANAGKQ